LKPPARANASSTEVDAKTFGGKSRFSALKGKPCRSNDPALSFGKAFVLYSLRFQFGNSTGEQLTAFATRILRTKHHNCHDQSDLTDWRGNSWAEALLLRGNTTRLT
jgi:hypothetical protein